MQDDGYQARWSHDGRFLPSTTSVRDGGCRLLAGRPAAASRGAGPSQTARSRYYPGCRFRGVGSFSWSPAGNVLFYVNGSSVHAIDALSGKRRRLATLGDSDVNTTIDGISTDGVYLVADNAAGRPPKVRGSVMLVGTDGSKTWRLPNHGYLISDVFLR